MKLSRKANVPRSGIHGVLADTCFWIAAFDPSAGDDHRSAAGLLEDLSRGVLLMPWPIMYEVLRTYTVKNPKMMDGFARVVRRPKVYKIDDSKYRSRCLEESFLIARRGRPISLVDLIVRAVLRDDDYRVTQLLTYNQRDFADVCRDRGVTMWPPSY
jgi:predicted nucleic acid-binding protein